MYGQSDNTALNSNDSSLSGEVKNSFSNGRNVQLESDLQTGRHQNDQPHAASPPQMNEDESLEDSFEPACFEATTPNWLENNANLLHHASNTSSSNCDMNYQQSMNSAKLESQNETFVQTSSQAYGQRVCSETNDTGGGKRSASQILALLGRSKGKFKPPVKESEVPAPRTFVELQAGHKRDNLGRHWQEQHVGQNKVQMVNCSSSQSATFQTDIVTERMQTNHDDDDVPLGTHDDVPSRTADGPLSTQWRTRNFGSSHVASSELKSIQPKSEVGSCKSLGNLSAGGSSSNSGVYVF